MADILGTGLETIEAGQLNWNPILTTNMEKIAEHLNGPFKSLYDLGEQGVTDVATGSSNPEILQLEAKINELLAALRKTTGCGVLAN